MWVHIVLTKTHSVFFGTVYIPPYAKLPDLELFECYFAKITLQVRETDSTMLPGDCNLSVEWKLDVDIALHLPTLINYATLAFVFLKLLVEMV